MISINTVLLFSPNRVSRYWYCFVQRHSLFNMLYVFYIYLCKTLRLSVFNKELLIYLLRRWIMSALETVLISAGRARDTIIYTSNHQVALRRNFVSKSYNFVISEKVSTAKWDHSADCAKFLIRSRLFPEHRSERKFQCLQCRHERGW